MIRNSWNSSYLQKHSQSLKTPLGILQITAMTQLAAAVEKI